MIVTFNLGLVIPVYGGQTGFTSVSINFYEKPMVETEPTEYKENMAAKYGKGLAKGDHARGTWAFCLRMRQTK